MVEACELVALQAASAFAGDARGTIALGCGMKQQRDRFSELRKRDGWRRLFFPDGFLC